jgi:hypothetical protein
MFGEDHKYPQTPLETIHAWFEAHECVGPQPVVPLCSSLSVFALAPPVSVEVCHLNRLQILARQTTHSVFSNDDVSACAKQATSSASRWVNSPGIRSRCTRLAAPFGVELKTRDLDRGASEKKKMIALVSKAWKMLAPLGVETADIRRSVDRAIRHAWRNSK